MENCLNKKFISFSSDSTFGYYIISPFLSIYYLHGLRNSATLCTYHELSPVKVEPLNTPPSAISSAAPCKKETARRASFHLTSLLPVCILYVHSVFPWCWTNQWRNVSQYIPTNK